MENIHMREWTTVFITEGRYTCKGLYIHCCIHMTECHIGFE